MVCVWSEEHGLFVDEMGLPLKIHELQLLGQLVAKVLSEKTATDIAEATRQVVTHRYPSMVDSFDFSSREYL